MKAGKRSRLENSGWVVGDAKKFLDLREDEADFIEIKLALLDGLKQRWLDQSPTQKQLVDRLAASRSRAPKRGAGDGTMSVDSLILSLLAMGTTRREIAQMIAGQRRGRIA